MDVDGDGQNDVLILNQGTGTIATLLSSNPGAPQVSNVGVGPIAFAPFRAGDGLPRIAIPLPGAITIFAWDGIEFQPVATVMAGASPSAVVNGDFNGTASTICWWPTWLPAPFNYSLGRWHGRLDSREWARTPSHWRWRRGQPWVPGCCGDHERRSGAVAIVNPLTDPTVTPKVGL
jgi:hypothetical protein